MKPRIGQTLASTVDETAVIVVRAPGTDVSITCGGAPMCDARERPDTVGGPDPAQADGTLLGKRYADDELGLELLCTKAGQGTLAVDGRPLPVKAAKALPASD
ncbi:hypothetical protein M271_49470 [Streptomyces rapamycinicus NRRL 5491]|uniref:Uncharacterized protein n=2 Tax=Streptomyces rapamycinicus TaxID=1226757 RepID=A0A0A0NUG7_STRRN|nr:hypothetical protein [Streptomyces rapamycinicus]AGP61256.1 hypothetical protein M271_49470 [Streptomyces rapamycinicus NRRL 5491]MBB4787565.1 hypothetical protein [Streptomyces rapamycinicus]RLV71907.1 hypothetical protein D3C57_145310 [Streptomyces rapamycinicus NRRL 5491]